MEDRREQALVVVVVFLVVIAISVVTIVGAVSPRRCGARGVLGRLGFFRGVEPLTVDIDGLREVVDARLVLLAADAALQHPYLFLVLQGALY